MRPSTFVLTSFLLGALAPSRALADAPPAYGDHGGYTITPPYSPNSFTTSLTAFPATTTRVVDGYPFASRMLAATGRTVSLQQTFGASSWLPVAVLDDGDPNMDPAFLALTPDGATIALGCGLGKPLYVFPASILSTVGPPVLTTDTRATRFAGLSYYSAAFRDDRYLFLDEGGGQLGESDIYWIDTKSSPAERIPVIASIPGASGGIAFDAAGDLVTGIGWDPNDTRTGEIKIFDAASISAAVAGGTSMSYDSNGAVVAKNLLSADSLGFDANGNLDVGGGDVFGSSGHYGYAQIVSADVIARVKTGGPPADPNDANDVTVVEPDPCHNDDWTGITYVPGVQTVVVTATLGTAPPNCASVDTTMGPGPATTIYVPPNAPDHDGDGVPDAVDPDFETQEVFGADRLSRLVNALDSTSTDFTFDSTVDFDSNGKIDDADYAFLTAHWGLPVSSP
jgi:hypothetical protein